MENRSVKFNKFMNSFSLRGWKYRLRYAKTDVLKWGETMEMRKMEGMRERNGFGASEGGGSVVRFNRNKYFSSDRWHSLFWTFC